MLKQADHLPDHCRIIGNNSKVVNTRLLFQKSSGAKIEIFVLEPHLPAEYQQAFATTIGGTCYCLLGNAKR